jgi:REP element-mobilizing transposase RayT
LAGRRAEEEFQLAGDRESCQGSRLRGRNGAKIYQRGALAESRRRFGLCLTPNHVHLILTPDDSAGLALAQGRLYAGFVNARARQTGRLFQGRFVSVAMDGDHLMAAARTVALNRRPRNWSGAPGTGPFQR